jgi:hypothetical protein
MLPYTDPTNEIIVLLQGIAQQLGVPLPIQPMANFYSVKITLSGADLYNLATTPKLLIAAPGAGKIISIYSGYAILRFNSIPYNTGNLFLTNTDNTVPQFLCKGITVSLNNASGLFVPQVNPAANVETIIENTGIFLTSTADANVGDSTLEIYINYLIQNV